MQTEKSLPKWLLVILQIPQVIIQFIFRGPLRPILDWFNRLITRIVFRFSAHEIFDNINLYCMDDDEKEIFFETTVEALKLLATNDHLRYNRVKKYLKNIALLPTPHGHFEASTSSYIVDSFDHNRRAEFAAECVHEATHGMLHSKGFKYEADKKRHETLCIREQFRTLRRLIFQLNPDMAEEKKQEMVREW